MGDDTAPRTGISCRRCRDAISARLDGEDDAQQDVAVDAHLAGCAPCRSFADDAAYVTRLARVRAADDVPDLVPAVLDAWAPPAHRRWPLDAVRAGLAVVALGQLAVAAVGAGVVGTGTTAAMDMTELGGASAVHFSHESAAWNLALGAAFAGAALHRRRPVAGLVSTVAVFVAVLAALSVPDLLAGRVDAARLLGHGLVVVGLGLLVAHRALGHGDGGAAPGSRRRRTAPPGSTTGPLGRRTAGDGSPGSAAFEATGRTRRRAA